MTISCGGLGYDLVSYISFLFRVLSALTAALNMGMTLSKSSWQLPLI